MARRSRNSTGRRTRSYNRRAARNVRGTLGTRRKDPSSEGAPRRSTTTIQSALRKRKTKMAERPKRTSPVRTTPADRRTPVHPYKLKKRSTRRLQAGVVSTPNRNENARSSKIRCARNKVERRAVLLAMGHGGINDFKKYRSHKKCPG